MLVDRLTGKRDILAPYFDVASMVRAAPGSPILRQIGQLRDEVGAERGAEPGADDGADHAARHFAAYAAGGVLVGAARLLQPAPAQPFPFEQACKLFDNAPRPPRAQCCELSQLVVRSTLRRRRGDSPEGIAQLFAERGTTAAILPRGATRDPRNHSPLLLLALYRAMYRYSRANGVRYWYAPMERQLARSLDTMGFKFLPIGPEGAGGLTPHLADLDDVSARLRTENPFLADWLNDEPIALWLRLRTLFASVRAALFR